MKAADTVGGRATGVAGDADASRRNGESGLRGSRLAPLLRPRSIAIVGASRNLDSLNGRPLKHLQVHGYHGPIYPVNPRYEEIAGLRCYPSLDALPVRPDVVVVGVGAARVQGVLEQCAELGIPAAIVFASGYAEMGEEGRRAQQEIAELAQRAGLLVCGPNTLGLLNAQIGAATSFSQAAARKLPRGPIAFVTQSGAFGTAITALAERMGIYFDYFLNTGNEASLQFADYVEDVLQDPAIRVVAGYIEGISDGPRFLDVARQAMEAGKPIVLAKVGRYGAGRRAAASHTGSLAGADAVYDAVLRQVGVLRVHDEEELLDTASLFASYDGPLPAGNAVALVTQSGGAGVLMADRCEELGLRVPELREETKARLRERMPPFAGVVNPVDITAQFIADPRLLEAALRTVAADPGVDVIVFYLAMMPGHAEEVVGHLKAARAVIDKPLIVAWAAAPEHAVTELRELGIPTVPTATRAVNALANFTRYAEARRRLLRQGAVGETVTPPPAVEWLRRTRQANAGPGTAVSDTLAREVLAAYGVTFPAEALVHSASEARAAADLIGYPVALKVVSPTLLHKTEAGAVALDLRDGAAVATGYERVLARARTHQPQGQVEGVLVQQMVADPNGVEVLVGVSRDPALGPIVAFGLGGIQVDLLHDVALRHAPFGREEAASMVRQIRGARLLDGFRGRPRADVAALVDLLVAVSRLAADLGDVVAEVDLNPVIVLPEGLGVRAVDRLIV
ncbi:MAG: acetate--CoA ligase family protein [Chloroflexota bacterium]|nr:acetate--CoA ligase family protein [Chloroflexota bacterium]